MGSIEKTASGRWRARGRDPEGVQKKQTFRLKAEAEEWLTQLEHAKLAGTYLDPARGRLTLAEWWEEYSQDVPKRPTTAARDRAVMSRWWLRALGRKRLRDITPADVKRTVRAMVDKGLKASTVKTHLGVFSAVMNEAVEAERITQSPVRGINLATVERCQPRFLSGDELDRLVDAMPEEYRAMVYVAAVLGLRWSEVIGLRAGRVDFLRRSVAVERTLAEVEGEMMDAPPKSTASARPVSAPVELLELLAAHIARTDRSGAEELLFAGPEGGALRRGNFRNRVWLPAVKAAGLGGLTFHGLRHSSVGFLIELGAHPVVIQQRTRHASFRTTADVYGAVLPSVDRAVADQLGQLLRGELQSSRAQFVPDSGASPSSS